MRIISFLPFAASIMAMDMACFQGVSGQEVQLRGRQDHDELGQRKLGWFDCPATFINKFGYFYKVEFADDSVLEGYSATADVSVEHGALVNSPDSSFLVHVSCSDTWANGYSDLGGSNGPLQANGDPSVTKYLILKFGYDKSGNCEVKKVCPDIGPTPAPTPSPTSSPTASPSASPTIPRCSSNNDCETTEFCAAPESHEGPRFCEPYAGPMDSCDDAGELGLCNPAESVCFASDSCFANSSQAKSCVAFAGQCGDSHNCDESTSFCYSDAAAGPVCLERYPEGFCCEESGNCANGLTCREDESHAMICQFPPPTPSPTPAPSASPTVSPTSSPTPNPTSSPTASPSASPTIPRCSSNSDCKATEYCAEAETHEGLRFCELYARPTDHCDDEGVLGLCNPAESVCFSSESCSAGSTAVKRCVAFAGQCGDSHNCDESTSFCYSDAAAGPVCLAKYLEGFCCDATSNCIDGLVCREDANLGHALTCQSPPPISSPTDSPVAAPIQVTNPPEDCPIFNHPESEHPLGIFDNTSNAYTCDTPLDVDRTSNMVSDGYSVELLESKLTTSASGATSTQFFYKVCTADTGCNTATRGRRELGGWNRRAAISHVVLELEGRCAVTDYKYYDLDGSTDGSDFPGLHVDGLAAYDIGSDPTTCVSGFNFDIGWDEVVSTGCQTNDFCRTLMVEIDGAIPTTEGTMAIKASTNFYLLDVAVPNCAAC